MTSPRSSLSTYIARGVLVGLGGAAVTTAIEKSARDHFAR
jgi:hypothetical protein